MSKIAKIILPLAINKKFDYKVPENEKIKSGMRVLVDFNKKKKVGIVASLSTKSKIDALKPIEEVIDSNPILGSNHFALAEKLASHYPYPASDFLFMMLPPELRKRKKHKLNIGLEKNKKNLNQEKIEFVKSDFFRNRYSLWKEKVKTALKKGSVVICLPQLTFVKKISTLLKKDFSQKNFEFFSQQKNKDLLDNWINSRKKSLILGTRSALFYFPQDTKLIIIEEETSPYYFQEVKPFYHLREVAFLLNQQLQSKIILSGSYPSLETYNKINRGEVKLVEPDISKKEINSKIRVISRNTFTKNNYINPILIELIRKTISEDKKGVLVCNKKNFWRIMACTNCDNILRCEYCSAFLHQEEKNKEKLLCPYCKKEFSYSKICPKCKKGYFKGKGMGVKKLEEIIQKFFPEIKLENFENHTSNSRLIVSTSKILNLLYDQQLFDKGFVLDADSYLSSFDFSVTFKTFIYLKNLALLFKDNLFVFSSRPDYYLFKYLSNDWHEFYEKELLLRKQLQLPPFLKIIKIILRHNQKEKTLKNSKKLYNIFKERKYNIYGPFEEAPHKLRGKYRYSLIIKIEKKAEVDKLFHPELNKIKRKGIQAAVIIE